MIDNNEAFDKVYNKLIHTIKYKLNIIYKLRSIGTVINYDMIKLLNLYIKYLDYIKYSEYKYFYVDSLNNISNYLNKI